MEDKHQEEKKDHREEKEEKEIKKEENDEKEEGEKEKEKEKETEKEQGKKKEKEKEKEEEEDGDCKVVIGDQEGGLHQIPLLIAASMTEVWKQVSSSPASSVIQLPLSKEILMHVLLYQRCCVCRHVKVLEEITNAREKLEARAKMDEKFVKDMKAASDTVASDSLDFFLECCGDLANFEELDQVETKDREEAFSRHSSRMGIEEKKPFTTLGALTSEEEKILGTLNIGSVKWVGANGPEKEEDLSFSWLHPKKEEPPAKIQATKIIENELHDSETVVQHLEEVL